MGGGGGGVITTFKQRFERADIVHCILILFLNGSLLRLNMIFFFHANIFFYHIIDVLKSAGCYVHSLMLQCLLIKKRVEFSSLLPPFLVQTL